MDNLTQPSIPAPAALLVKAGMDRFSEERGLGVSRVTFKVSGQDNRGLFMLENIFHQKGGPGKRHGAPGPRFVAQTRYGAAWPAAEGGMIVRPGIQTAGASWMGYLVFAVIVGVV